MATYRPETETCPVCGSTGNCRPHAHYDRYIVDFCDGCVSQEHLSILRLYCKSCRHTHAVLPDFIIPYSTYGITFILRVLQAYFSRSESGSLRTVESICHAFGISCRLLYRWLDLFRTHKYRWLGVLEDSEISAVAFIDDLLNTFSFSDFLRGFFQKLAISFLQHHKNPMQERPKGARSVRCPCGSSGDFTLST